MRGFACWLVKAAAMQTTKSVMIVDDAPLMRLVVQNILRADNRISVVATASNGKEALDHLTRHPTLDLILLDIEMPQMDGLEFLRHARLKTRARIVVLSSVAAYGSPKAAEARKLGASAVIAKPSGAVSLDLEQTTGSLLLKTVQNLLGLMPQ